MPSPFPGMDPYLEAPVRWLDFHNDLATEIRAALNRALDPRYVATLTSYVAYETVEIAPSSRNQRRSDVSVVRMVSTPTDPSAAIATASPEPVESAIPWETPMMLDRVEILTTEGEKLVTVIEILSPSNKRANHDDGQEYRRKRKELFRSSTHLLEIDLLRAGDRMPLAEPVPVAPYYVMLSREKCRPGVHVWPIRLQDRLPTVPVPLLEGDTDVTLDLGAAVASVYERGAFERRLDYSLAPPPPALSEADTAWMDALLREHGRR
jgi:Protein of unknown function (DUF4058)